MMREEPREPRIRSVWPGGPRTAQGLVTWPHRDEVRSSLKNLEGARASPDLSGSLIDEYMLSMRIREYSLNTRYLPEYSLFTRILAIYPNTRYLLAIYTNTRYLLAIYTNTRRILAIYTNTRWVREYTLNLRVTHQESISPMRVLSVASFSNLLSSLSCSPQSHDFIIPKKARIQLH